MSSGSLQVATNIVNYLFGVQPSTGSIIDYQTQAITTWQYIVDQLNTTLPPIAVGVLSVSGSVSITQIYSLVLINATGGNVNVALPNNIDNGFPMTFKRVDGSVNNVIIAATNIDGNPSISLDAQNQSTRLILYSGIWYIS